MLAILASLKSNLETELRNFYSKYGKDGVVTYAEARKWASNKDHRRRLTILLFYVTQNFDELRVSLTHKFREMLKDVISKESTLFEVTPDSDEILTESWGTDDKSWSERLEDDITLWCAYILMDIKQSLLKGRALEETLAKINKRFKYMDYILETLGLSESTAIGSMARRKIFSKLGITRYRFYTKVDERRCETCGAMHGLIFPISAYEVGVTASPLHPRCRCWEVPIMD